MDREELEGRADDLAAAKARLAELEEQIQRATRFAVKAGHDDEVAAVLAELDAERQALRARLAAVAPSALDLGALRECLEFYVKDLQAVDFEKAPEQGRRIFETLLAGGRMRVLEDTERGFRVEGVFELDPGRERPVPLEGDRATLAGGSGGRI